MLYVIVIRHINVCLNGCGHVQIKNQRGGLALKCGELIFPYGVILLSVYLVGFSKVSFCYLELTGRGKCYFCYWFKTVVRIFHRLLMKIDMLNVTLKCFIILSVIPSEAMLGFFFFFASNDYVLIIPHV